MKAELEDKVHEIKVLSMQMRQKEDALNKYILKENSRRAELSLAQTEDLDALRTLITTEEDEGDSPK